jgi:hypothetical protein
VTGSLTSFARRRSAYALGVAGDLATRASHRVRANGGPSLSGDRWVEWSFCMARLADGPGTTLDFGADIGFLSLAAAQRGHDVLALDREDVVPEYTHPRVEHLHADVLDRPLGDRRFDQIVNCSSVEHVGLPGRYGSGDQPDGDLETMAFLAAALTDGGRHILTVPVGRDEVFPPYHRVYGEERLPRLLECYRIVEEQYWTKGGRRWAAASREQALATPSSPSFYALGLFVLAAA